MNTPSLRIIHCSTRDAETMAMVHALVLPKGWGADEFIELLTSNGVCGYLALNTEGFACGLLLVRRAVDECEILTLGVLYEMQRQGIARSMVHYALHREQEHGVRLVHLEVQEDNTDALAFYETLGFLPVGRRTGYYETREGRKDAILMSRTII